jgi:hypothetical protein
MASPILGCIERVCGDSHGILGEDFLFLLCTGLGFCGSVGRPTMFGSLAYAEPFGGALEKRHGLPTGS